MRLPIVCHPASGVLEKPTNVGDIKVGVEKTEPRETVATEWCAEDGGRALVMAFLIRMYIRSSS